MARTKRTTTPLDIQVSLSADRVAVLQQAFGERDERAVAQALAQLAVNELIDLLSGTKRYLSLSHQYIEWIQKIYEMLLPDEEFTYRRIFDRFNFPPGSAAYIARVLRDRQNTVLHQRAKEGLRRKCEQEVRTYDKLPAADRPAARHRVLKLTVREFDLLQTLVDRLLAEEQPVEYPAPTSRSREMVVTTYDVDYVRRVPGEVDRI